MTQQASRHITIGQARDFLATLHFQAGDGAGLTGACVGPNADPENAARILATVRRLGCVQYDPLDVVGRNHDLVLQSRVPDYRPDQLDRALYGPLPRTLVEGLDKNLALYPVEDWPCLERMRSRMFANYGTRPAVADVLPAIRERFGDGGPLSSDDLEYGDKVDWPWGPTRLARAALESMWYGGEIVLHHRERTRRFYELTRRLLPAGVLDAPPPFADDGGYFRWHTLRRIRSVGLLRSRPSDAWLGICGYGAETRAAAFHSLVADEAVVPVRIDGLPESQPYHLAAEHLPVLDAAAARHGEPSGAAAVARILAPLDNLIWDRRMVREIFGFDYTWEVYTPVPKRKYGYYVLPVMDGSRFVARFEPERHRRGCPLTVRHWWWEPDACPDHGMRTRVEAALDRFAAYLGAPGIEMNAPF